MRFLTTLTVSVIVLITIFLAAGLFFEKTHTFPTQVKYGVSFSPNYARYLGLDWQKVYLQMLDDLKVRNLRLPGYWTSLESKFAEDDFSETDFLISEAEKRGARVILVVGARQPRWPECHYPAWAKNLSVAQRQQKTLEFIRKVIERYKNNPAIWAWQVENEPYVAWFGENCDLPDKDFLQKEIELIKKLDPKNLVIITDSGEWGSWVGSMKFSDILGISVYRKSYNQQLKLYTTYPLPSWIYPLKSNLMRRLFAPQNQKTIIAELQAEPWTKDAIPDTPLEEQIKLFTTQDFKNNTQYAQKTGFDEIYLWGVEWWFWLAQKGYPQYLDYAKTLF